MSKYYFTYGSEGHPYVGGWTEVEADNKDLAIIAFDIYHPSQNSFLNCCCVYSEEEFKSTRMAGPNGNFGYFCHETITLQRCVIVKEVQDG